VLLVALLFVSPGALALTYSRYPPYGGGFAGWSLYGYVGNYGVYKHDLSVYPSDGSIGFHLGADTGPPSGAVWVAGTAGFSGAAFTPGLTGSYTITYTFQIVSGNAQLYTAPGGNANLVIWFRANLEDLTHYSWVQNNDVSTVAYSGQMCCGGAWSQDLSGRYFTVQFSGYLSAGTSYGILGYEHVEIQLDWPYSGPWADALTDQTAKLISVTADIASGGGGCVMRDTSILTPSGDVSVQSLKTGDAVDSFDFSTGRLIQTRVTSITKSTVSNIVSINNGTLWLTPYDQPIYMRNSKHTGWLKNPGELVAGDYIFDAVSQTWVFVYSTEQRSGSFKVYDLRTSGPNNFIAEGILLDMK
jgi:hypothetical protein